MLVNGWTLVNERTGEQEQSTEEAREIKNKIKNNDVKSWTTEERIEMNNTDMKKTLNET